jgi:hypothetical protein
MNAMRCCLNPKVIVGLAAVALGFLVVSPHLLGAALPLLIGLICPLSMIAMVIAMAGPRKTQASPGFDADKAELVALRQEVQRLRNRQTAPDTSPAPGVG